MSAEELSELVWGTRSLTRLEEGRDLPPLPQLVCMSQVGWGGVERSPWPQNGGVQGKEGSDSFLRHLWLSPTPPQLPFPHSYKETSNLCMSSKPLESLMRGSPSGWGSPSITIVQRVAAKPAMRQISFWPALLLAASTPPAPTGRLELRSGTLTELLIVYLQHLVMIKLFKLEHHRHAFPKHHYSCLNTRAHAWIYAPA